MPGLATGSAIFRETASGFAAVDTSSATGLGIEENSGVFTSAPVFDDDGRLVFRSFIDTLDTSADVGVFRETSTGFERVVTEGDVLPGSTGRAVSDPQVSAAASDGKVAFFDPGAGTADGILGRSIDGVAEIFAQEGALNVDGFSETLRTLQPAAINSLGDLAFFGSSSNVPVCNSGAPCGLFAERGDEIHLVATQGTKIEFLPGDSRSLSTLSLSTFGGQSFLSDSGHIIFNAGFSGADNPGLGDVSAIILATPTSAVAPVPLPATAWLLLGGIGLLWCRRRSAAAS